MPTPPQPRYLSLCSQGSREARGLGLAIDLFKVQAHTGRIVVSSQKEKGAEFTLTFHARPEVPSQQVE